MNSPFWPRTFRGWLALQLARVAARLAETRFICHAGYNIKLDTDWEQPMSAGAGPHDECCGASDAPCRTYEESCCNPANYAASPPEVGDQ